MRPSRAPSTGRSPNSLLGRARLTRATGATGAVTLIQRFGSALNLNIYLHVLVLDGAYLVDTNPPVFRRIAPPTEEELKALAERSADTLGQPLDERLQLGLARRRDASEDRRLGAHEIRAVEHEHVVSPPNLGQAAALGRCVREFDVLASYGSFDSYQFGAGAGGPLGDALWYRADLSRYAARATSMAWIPRRQI